MTTGKAAALALGFVGAVALGIAIGPPVGRSASPSNTDASATVEAVQPVPEAAEPAQTAAQQRRVVPRATASSAPAAPETSAFARMSASEPRLHERMKPVFNRGTQMKLAAEGFRSAEEFATLAHAARNTQVPFVLLKHRVLNEGRSLADAIHESRPDMVDPHVEVTRAQAEARADLAH